VLYVLWISSGVGPQQTDRAGSRRYDFQLLSLSIHNTDISVLNLARVTMIPLISGHITGALIKLDLMRNISAATLILYMRHKVYRWIICFYIFYTCIFIHSLLSRGYPIVIHYYFLGFWCTYFMVQHITWKADSHSACQKISCFLMEPEGSLPCSHKPATGPYPEPVKSSSPHR
jgi:hypothetical protein